MISSSDDGDRIWYVNIIWQFNEAGHPRRFYDSVILLFLANIVFIIAS
jgi:hypothetical protein